MWKDVIFSSFLGFKSVFQFYLRMGNLLLLCNYMSALIKKIFFFVCDLLEDPFLDPMVLSWKNNQTETPPMYILLLLDRLFYKWELDQVGQ